MFGITDDPSDPRIVRGSNDEQPTDQHEVYLVATKEERSKGFIRPYRTAYRHIDCPVMAPAHAITTMNVALAETYARNPDFYGATYCVHCRRHRRVGIEGEFEWMDGSKVGT